MEQRFCNTSAAGEPLIVIAGPTASGKTSLSVQLAEMIGGEIISADSMQVYRGMDIGSAKAAPEEMRGIPHHLIDILDPDEDFNILLFQKKALEAAEGIRSRGRIPILVGGTGFYIQSVTRKIDFTEAEGGTGIRRRLEELASENGPEWLHQKLREADPLSAEQIHPNNVKRVIRALEFFEQNHSPISMHNAAEKKRETPYNLAYFVLNMPRDELYRRIDSRVDQMLKAGLTDEVRRLKEQGCRRGMTSMQGLGYKEILDYLDGKVSLEEAVRILKRDTRHFAKRQLTWFRREEDAIWIPLEEYGYDPGRILNHVLSILIQRGLVREGRNQE